MVNVGFSWGSLIGIVLAVAGAALYFLRSVRPGLARDYDIFFAAVGLLCGGILFFNSWRLDPILQFSQFLLAGSTIFFAYESVRLRGVATEQAKRSAPPVSYEDDRPVSRVYRAELDELEPQPPPQPFLRRIRGTEDGASAGPDEYGAYGGFEEGPPSGRRRRPPGGGRPTRSRPPVDGTGDEPRRRPPGARPEGRPEGRPGRSPRSPVEADGWDQDDGAGPPLRSPAGRPPRGRRPVNGPVVNGPMEGPPMEGPVPGRRPRRPAPEPPERSGPRPGERMDRPGGRPVPPRSPRVALEDIGTPYLDEEEPPTRSPGRSSPVAAEEPYVDYQPIEPTDGAAVNLEDRPRSPQTDGPGVAEGRPLDLGPPPRPERPERPPSSRVPMDLDDDYGDGDEDDYDDGDMAYTPNRYGSGAYDDADDEDDLGDDLGRPRRDR